MTQSQNGEGEIGERSLENLALLKGRENSSNEN